MANIDRVIGASYRVGQKECNTFQRLFLSAYYFLFLILFAGLVAVDIVFEGSPKPEHQQLEVRVVRGHFFVASPEDNGVEECLE